MWKNTLSTVSLLFISCLMQAQPGNLVVHNSGKSLYLEHKVAPKENFYSIGRLYNVHPRHIATYNAVDMSKGLSVGQSLKIPLTDSNFIQKGERGTPVYYIVGDNEGLMKVSNNNNKVLLQSLRQWNNLQSDNLSKGQQLIVGFLVSNEMQTAAIKEIVKKEVETNKEKQVKTEPANPVEKKPEPEKPIVTEHRLDKEKSTNADVEEPKNENTLQQSSSYFKSFFDQQIRQQPVTKEQTLTAGIFKTTTGWTDGKFYLLMDGIEPGTVVKLTNPTNNKIIYAKVLGDMNGVKKSPGMNIRISNAAASALQIPDTDKFIVKVNY